MSKLSSGATGNRSTNRFSALQSLAAEQDTEIEDELARCKQPTPTWLDWLPVPSPFASPTKRNLDETAARAHELLAYLLASPSSNGPRQAQKGGHGELYSGEERTRASGGGYSGRVMQCGRGGRRALTLEWRAHARQRPDAPAASPSWPMSRNGEGSRGDVGPWDRIVSRHALGPRMLTPSVSSAVQHKSAYATSRPVSPPSPRRTLSSNVMSGTSTAGSLFSFRTCVHSLWGLGSVARVGMHGGENLKR